MRVKKNVRQVIQRIVEVLKKYYQPEQIILFGSYALGTPAPDSDIDLLIVKTTHQPFFHRLAEVRRLVSDIRRGYAFDPIVLTPTELKRRLAIGDQFFEEIVTKGQVLYANQ